MSKVMSVEGAGADKLTVNFAAVVPLLPSASVTSLIVRLGSALARQLLAGAPLLRGSGTKIRKSAALSFVSVQPPALRRSAVVLLGAGARPEPSKQLAVVPEPTKAAILVAKGHPLPV